MYTQHICADIIPAFPHKTLPQDSQLHGSASMLRVATRRKKKVSTWFLKVTFLTQKGKNMGIFPTFTTIFPTFTIFGFNNQVEVKG